MRPGKRLSTGAVTAALGVGAVVLVVDITGGGTASAAPPISTSDAVQRKADEVFRSFDGSKLERDAGAVLSVHALNISMDRCMAKAGFPEWDWSMPRAQNPTSHGLESSDFFAPPLARSFTTSAMESAESVKAEQAARTRELSDEESAAVADCEKSVPPTSDEASSPSPPEAAKLRDEWWAMLGSLDEKYGNQTEYAECLAKSPIPGLGTISSDDEAVLALYDLEPRQTDQWPTSASDPKASGTIWNALVAAEAAWEQADWTCRGSIYNEHLSDVAKAIDQFALDHSDEIRQAESAWAATLKAAEDLGFDGTYSPIR